MTKIGKGLLLIIIIMLVTLLMPGLIDNANDTVEANDAGWSEDGTEGDESEAYTILELVPYKDLSEIGYLVGGQEPIDEELFTTDNAEGAVSFLGGAISVFRSYTESLLPSSGTSEEGWVPANTVVTQNGYFEQVGNANGGRYNKTTGDRYLRVPEGTGDYKAKLVPGADMENVYKTWNPTNRKNVKAYFVLGKPEGVALYHSTRGYEPYSVTKNPTKTGDYDYDTATGTFVLNKGHGAYDVIFTSVENSSNMYYMTANYEIVDDNSGYYSFPIQYVEQVGGNYKKETGTLFKYDRWNGSYRWTQDEVALSKPFNYMEEDGKIYVKEQKVTVEYQYMYEVEMINNEWLKRMTLGVPSSQVEDYPVRVITITPDELNLAENQHYIEEADLFYINENYNHNWSYIDLYEEHSFEGQSLSEDEKFDAIKSSVNFAEHDLSWASVLKIFKRVAGIGTYKASIIMDNSFYFDAIKGNGVYSSLSKQVSVEGSHNNKRATMSNMAKLYIMLVQRNMVDFYNSFLNPAETDDLITEVGTSINSTGTTGSFIRPDSSNSSSSADEAIYWNEYTFLPYGLNADGDMVRFHQNELVDNGIDHYGMMGSVHLTNNILILDGRDVFTRKFVEHLPLPHSNKEILDYLNSLNPEGTIVKPNTITLSDVINMITNQGLGYGPVGGISYPDGSYVEGVHGDSGADEEGNLRTYKRVLNIQPTADFEESEAQIRNVLKGYDVQIVNMTSIQFNGSIEDINARYDMIYMGSGAGRFNNYDGHTIFNDIRLYGSIYFSVGDIIFIDDRRFYDFYRGNDITSQKKDELELFLDAGYPVVLDPVLYQAYSYYVRGDTKISSFITHAKYNYNNILNYADYTSHNNNTKKTFLYKLQYALNIIRPIVQKLMPVLEETSEVNYVYANPETDLFTIRFKLLSRGKTPSYCTYDAFLYMDENGDGIFDSSEKVNVISNDGSSWKEMRESRNRTYTYQYDMSKLNGVYQWKVVIKRQDNEEIRGAISGYAANTEKENIYILQITENTSEYNLENKVNDSASLIWKYASTDKLKDYNLIFDTVTVQEFQELYVKAPYTTATAETTNKLSNYHLVILDNPSTKITAQNGAITNIKDEIDKDLGVVFTKNALGYERQDAYYYNDNKYSFLDDNTYNYLNRLAYTIYGHELQFYIYNNLTANGKLNRDETYKTSYLTKSNEGAVTRYPYQINQAIQIAQNSYSNNVTVDFDLSRNHRLVGWYCLSDSKSTVVRNEGLVTGGSDSELYQGMYSSSPNDVKNNCYLFSNGRSFYSGIQLRSADQYGNDNEIKLFVNTIIATYKASERIISTPPVIQFVDPIPIIEPDLSESIIIKQEDLIDDEFILTFALSESSSNMDLEILLGDINPLGSWNERIYLVTATGTILEEPIPIDNTDKAIAVGTYALKIPREELAGEPKLTLSAINMQGNLAVADVILKYMQNPIVTIEDPVPVTNETNQVIYVDIDYNAVDAADMNAADEFRVVFKIDQALTEVLVDITSGEVNLADGASGSVSVYKIEENGSETALNLSLPTPNGSYVMYLPVSLMKGLSSREITITATDLYGNPGSVTVTLLRRSLFPLD